MNIKKLAVVCGAGGFIGSHLVKKLKSEGFWVRGVDLKYPQYSSTEADDFLVGDLTCPIFAHRAIPDDVDELYQLAADMGGAGYIFTGENDANVMHNSALINLNIAHIAVSKRTKNLFYSSSACVYPEYNQLDPNNPKCSEESAYPAAPDSEYGWEKLFSERLFLAYKRNHKLNVHVARYHNIFGPEGTYKGGKEKSPAALCRKVIEAPDGGEIEIWGDGQQTRSFLYIDECVEGTLKLMRSDFDGPVNIGSEEMISINDFAKMIIELSGKKLTIKNISGPLGVRGRKSDNKLIREKLFWAPSQHLKDGIQKTYNWIKSQIEDKQIEPKS
jgi:nucleoside-diphosphate-sugar epimerase